jgi:hypothetical protein
MIFYRSSAFPTTVIEFRVRLKMGLTRLSGREQGCRNGEAFCSFNTRVRYEHARPSVNNLMQSYANPYPDKP